MVRGGKVSRYDFGGVWRVMLKAFVEGDEDGGA